MGIVQDIMREFTQVMREVSQFDLLKSFIVKIFARGGRREEIDREMSDLKSEVERHFVQLNRMDDKLNGLDEQLKSLPELMAEISLLRALHRPSSALITDAPSSSNTIGKAPMLFPPEPGWKDMEQRLAISGSDGSRFFGRKDKHQLNGLLIVLEATQMWCHSLKRESFTATESMELSVFLDRRFVRLEAGFQWPNTTASKTIGERTSRGDECASESMEDYYSSLGTRFPANSLKDQEVRTYREIERQSMHKARAEKQYTESNSIEKGIVELISQCGIRKLMMGAVANKHYSKKMVDIKSKKANYVHLQAPDFCLFSSRSNNTDACTNLYEKLKQTITEVTNLKRAFDEAQRRAHAEKDAIDAIRKAAVAASLYTVELRQRKELEDALVEEKEKLNDMKNQCEKVMEELRISQMQRSSLENQIENQIAESDQTTKELEKKIISVVDMLTKYKTERDELQRLRDSALREAHELRRALGENSSTRMPQFFSEFSFSEIEEATRYFDPSMKIGEGEYGSIYRGFLRHTEVAVKILNSHSLQVPSEFQQEVDVLSKMRHPNLVTLIGACPEAWILVYEYLPNGSLEDRLSCKDNSPPLSWKCRIRIATELCSAIMFLHSGKPHSVIHGDLKPANVLLDSNYGCKLGNFGISRLVPNNGSNNNVTHIYLTDPKGTFAYMDPEFVSTGELTVKSDVYSFGIILLRLLTGRSALRIAKEVQYALENGNLKTLLDPLAGDWPFVQAEQLARLALRCCDVNRRSRPDLAVDVCRVLEPMKALCSGGSLTFCLDSDEHFQPPGYFICPILLEVMQDPQVAADGFTYEAEALKGWLGSGHNTSPMTNLMLDNSTLIPNHALRSSIQEWLQNR